MALAVTALLFQPPPPPLVLPRLGRSGEHWAGEEGPEAGGSVPPPVGEASLPLLLRTSAHEERRARLAAMLPCGAKGRESDSVRGCISENAPLQSVMRRERASGSGDSGLPGWTSFWPDSGEREEPPGGGAGGGGEGRAGKEGVWWCRGEGRVGWGDGVV